MLKYIVKKYILYIYIQQAGKLFASLIPDLREEK